MRRLMMGAVMMCGAMVVAGCGGVETEAEQAGQNQLSSEIGTVEQAITYNNYNYVCAVDLTLRYQPGGQGFCTLHKWDIVYAYYPPSGDYADVWVYSSIDPNCVHRRGWVLKSYISRSC